MRQRDSFWIAFLATVVGGAMLTGLLAIPKMLEQKSAENAVREHYKAVGSVHSALDNESCEEVRKQLEIAWDYFSVDQKDTVSRPILRPENHRRPCRVPKVYDGWDKAMRVWARGMMSRPQPESVSVDRASAGWPKEDRIEVDAVVNFKHTDRTDRFAVTWALDRNPEGEWKLDEQDDAQTVTGQ